MRRRDVGAGLCLYGLGVMLSVGGGPLLAQGGPGGNSSVASVGTDGSNFFRAASVSKMQLGDITVDRWADSTGAVFLNLPEDWSMSFAINGDGKVRFLDRGGEHEAQGPVSVKMAPWKIVVDGKGVDIYPMVADDGVCFTFLHNDGVQ